MLLTWPSAGLPGLLQAAKVVAEVLQQTPPGTNVVLEAGVSEAAVATPLAFAVAEVSACSVSNGSSGLLGFCAATAHTVLRPGASTSSKVCLAI